MDANVTALIIDDEQLARDRIKMMLRESDGIEVVGECTNGIEAVESIEQLNPDLVFLDIQMPGFSGFEVIRAIGPAHMPAIVFITAYDEYAVKAFDVHAIDYLLKPFDRPRFATALQKALREVAVRRKSGSTAAISELMATLQRDRQFTRRILVKTAGRVAILRTEQIDWVEAAGNYVQLHIGPDIHLLRETMKGMSERLDPRSFVRIHRKSIVNIDRIKQLQPHFHGDFAVILQNGSRLTLSRRYRDIFERVFGKL